MTTPTIPPPGQATRARGLDVSQWSGLVDFAAALSEGNTFLLARSTLGTRPDRGFASNIKRAREAGLVVGSYHGFICTLDPESQARGYHQVAEGEGLLALPSFLPVTDFESLRGMDVLEATKRALAFTEAVEQLWGISPGDSIFYSYPSFIKTLSNVVDASALVELARRPLWIADYRGNKSPEVPSPFQTWAMWQTAGNAAFHGAIVDVDVAAGDLPLLQPAAG